MPGSEIAYPRDYRLLWMGGLTADVAISSFVFAIPLIILRVTGSAGMSGIVAGIVGVAAVVGRAPGGAFADRHNRRTVMIVSQLAQAGTFAALAALLLTGMTSAVLFALLAIAAALCASVNDASENAAITNVVPEDRLQGAHGTYQGRAHAANLLGPAVGGVLLAISPAVVAGVAAAACMVAVVCNLLMRSSFAGARSDEESFLRSIGAGFSHVARDANLRVIIVLQFFKNLAVSGAMFVMVISLEAAGVPTALIGVLSGLLGACGILGAILVPVVTRSLSFHAVLIVSSVATVLALGAAAFLTGTVMMAVPLALSILLSPSSGAVVFARIAAEVSPERLGRVLSVQTLCGAAGGAVSKPAMGATYGALGAVGGVLSVGAAIVSLLATLNFWRMDRGR